MLCREKWNQYDGVQECLSVFTLEACEERVQHCPGDGLEFALEARSLLWGKHFPVGTWGCTEHKTAIFTHWTQDRSLRQIARPLFYSPLTRTAVSGDLFLLNIHAVLLGTMNPELLKELWHTKGIPASRLEVQSYFCWLFMNVCFQKYNPRVSASSWHLTCEQWVVTMMLSNNELSTFFVLGISLNTLPALLCLVFTSTLCGS